MTRKTPRIIAKAGPNFRCQCCDKPLTGKFAWLELDQRTYTYHDFGDVPEAVSQGFFAFGLTCAKRKLAEHIEATAVVA